MSPLLGPVELSIQGSHPARALIAEELGAISGDGAKLRLELTVGADPPQSDSAHLRGSRLLLRHAVSSYKDGLRLSVGIKHGPTLYTVDIGPDLLTAESVHAAIYLPRNLGVWSRMSKPFVRLLSRDASTLLEVAAKNAVYELIDALAQYRMLGSGYSLVHASAVNGPNGVVAIAGTGGVGKSTALLAAMTRHPQLSYLADDMLVLGEDGSVFRHPKRIQVYSYNVAHEAELKRTIDRHLSRWRQVIWSVRSAVLGHNQARIRISAKDLFGASRVVDRGELHAIVWAQPAPDERFALHQIASDQVASSCAAALVDELWDFVRLMNLGSVLGSGGMPVGVFQDRVQSLYANAFAGVPVYEMSVPSRADTRVLADAVAAIAMG